MGEKPLVLVTGGTGFLATWVIVFLFRQGYRVRTTVRSLQGREVIKRRLHEAEINKEQISSLEVVEADLLRDDGWIDAMKDVVYVQHIASPYPSGLPQHEDEVVIPAREGTLRVLRHAHDARSVIRVVLTSSAAANGAGQPHSTTELQSFHEEDWGNPNSSDISAYPKSKILAERAAWEYIESGTNLELTTINPALLLGPTLDAHISTSLRTVAELLEGNMPGLPRLSFSIVDVRDCANMHVMAMTHPRADKQRFLCVSDNGVSMLDLAKILKKNLGSKANKVPTIVLPNFLIHIIAIFLPIARLIVPDLGILTAFSNTKAKQLLGWASQYTAEQMIVASAESLLKYKAVKV